ncbi:MAG TPA: phosphatidylglycerol lysyltransferase domain-containing protein [Agriterribacter sp.]|nr:phosphatidylglycerol lysyltransferase domain-containing protein [Agriterribacter sp.]
MKRQSFISKNFSPGSHWKEILAVLVLLLAIVFFKSERRELQSILPRLSQSNPYWIFSGFMLTVVYIYLQSGIYNQCFAAVDLHLSWKNGVLLFLKRNFVSVFLPAGGVSSLAYSPLQLRRMGFNSARVHQASGLFGIAGIITVFIAGLPVVMYNFASSGRLTNSWWGLLFVLVLIAAVYFAYRSFAEKGWLFQMLNRWFPSFTPAIAEVVSADINRKNFLGAISYSMVVELSGMLHVYIAMLAIGVVPSFGAAAAGYIISVLLMIISPFLRGLGAVELSMVYVLEQFGYSSGSALSITVLYRIFEFWLPMALGLLSFGWNSRKVIYRVVPVLLTFLLGVINIISVIEPPVHSRIRILRQYLPLDAIHASNILILYFGLALVVTSAYLIRGLRNAWMVAVVITVFSLAGHLTKNLEYQEAFLALTVLIILIASAPQYKLRSSARFLRLGVKTALLVFGAVIVFGFVSFYFIDARHFHIDFSWKQSLLHTLKMFLLVDDDALIPATRFGMEFILLIRTLGFLTWAFLLFALIKTERQKHLENENHREKAKFLLQQYGDSALDYFKTYKDKLIFLSGNFNAFIAYRISGAFAIVLEGPVCEEEFKPDILLEFKTHCRRMGLKPAFYRVGENSLHYFHTFFRNKIVIGQEAIIDVNHFSLSGGDRKSLRNGLNALQQKGFTTTCLPAPQSPDLLSKLRKVSDEWLGEAEKPESHFSQGVFDEDEIRNQDIIAVMNAKDEIKAFLNIIPDYAEDDCTYDLIRKTQDAPAAAMDALMVKLVDYARTHDKQFINLGLAPMTGIEQPNSTAERLIKMAGEKIKRFQHYKGLRAFKEKYATIWENKYLVYENDFDLLQLPMAIHNVMKR